MKFYTSSYQTVLAQGIDENAMYISISNSIQKNFPKNQCRYFASYRPLIPNWLLVEKFKNKLINWSEYTIKYEEQTNIRNTYYAHIDYLTYLAKKYQCNKVILLCYEKNNNNCHRSIVGKYFNAEELPY